MKTRSSRITLMSLAAGLFFVACDSTTNGPLAEERPGVSAAVLTDIDTNNTPMFENLKVCKVWEAPSGVTTDFTVTTRSSFGGSDLTGTRSVDDGQCKIVSQFDEIGVGVGATDLLRVVETQPAGTELVSISAREIRRDGTDQTITVNTGTPTAGPVAGSGSQLDFATKTWQATRGNNNVGYLVTFTNRVLPTGGEGCTPGYWKNHAGIHSLSKGGQKKPSSWEVYSPTDSFNSVFGVTSSFGGTLIEALIRGGGDEAALGRHAVAALLNAAHSGVDYDLTAAQVIAIVQAAYASDDFDTAKNQLAVLNEQGCPLGIEGI